MAGEEVRVDVEVYVLWAQRSMANILLGLTGKELFKLKSARLICEVMSALAVPHNVIVLYCGSETPEDDFKYLLEFNVWPS